MSLSHLFRRGIFDHNPDSPTRRRMYAARSGKKNMLFIDDVIVPLFLRILKLDKRSPTPFQLYPEIHYQITVI